MTDPAHLEEMVHKAWGYARQARQFSQMAHTRATLTTHAVQCAYHRAGMASLALSMPKADSWTLSITATILARNGLLDGKPAIRASAGGARRPTTMPPRRAKGRRR
jgi:hypothetical protein